jgi:hypothetical protein
VSCVLCLCVCSVAVWLWVLRVLCVESAVLVLCVACVSVLCCCVLRAPGCVIAGLVCFFSPVFVCVVCGLCAVCRVRCVVGRADSLFNFVRDYDLATTVPSPMTSQVPLTVSSPIRSPTQSQIPSSTPSITSTPVLSPVC